MSFPSQNLGLSNANLTTLNGLTYKYLKATGTGANLASTDTFSTDVNAVVTGTLSGNGNKWAEVVFSADPNATSTVITTINVPVKIAGTTTFTTTATNPLWSNDSGVSNRIKRTSNSASPYTHFKFEAIVTGLCATNDRSFDLVIAKNGTVVAKSKQTVSYHSDREYNGSMRLLVDASTVATNDYYECYCTNIENTDDITYTHMYFSVTNLV